MPDLPARRRAPPGWTRPITERLTPVIKGLILTIAISYAIYVFFREARPLMVAYLAVGPRLFRGAIWQPVTSLFVHVDPLSVALDIVGIWFTGAQLERAQGTRRFLTLFFTAGIASNLAMAAVDHALVPAALDPVPLYGVGTVFAVMALFVAFARIYDREPAQILGGLYLRPRYMVIFLLAWFVIMALVQRRWGDLAATVVSAIVGFVGAAPGGFDVLWLRFKTYRKRRRYRVLEGGNRPAKKYLN